MTRLYLSPPHMDGDERERLLAAFDSNWITPLGPEVDGFEAELAARSGRSHGAALSSGTAALHLALILTGVGADDEVVVPTLTFAATANAVTYVGAAPVFIDSEFATWNLDPDLLGEFLAARATQGRLPAAVVSVDLYGQCADYDRIVPVCEQYGVPLIVDAAEALGATWGGQPAGSFGVFGVFSFNGNKIITSGGGGMLTGDDGDKRITEDTSPSTSVADTMVPSTTTCWPRSAAGSSRTSTARLRDVAPSTRCTAMPWAVSTASTSCRGTREANPTAG